MNNSLYAQDGVNVETGDTFSKIAGEVCRSSFENSQFVEVMDFADDHFRGPRAFRFKNLPEGYFFDAAPDGIGTKVVVIDAAGEHYGCAQDVIAMTCSDISRWGGRPVVFVNVLDVSTLDEPGSETFEAYKMMMKGLGSYARENQLVCFRGETAELGKCVGSENESATTKFNWAGFAIGVYLRDRMITGESLAPGQVVIALRENGFRSNGLSSVRKALQIKFGDEWWNNEKARDVLKQASTPSKSYDHFLCDMNGWTNPIRPPKYKIHLITHVTGGGIVDKFAKDMLFPRGLSANLDNLFEPSDVVKDVISWRGMSAHEAYRTFNCGNGALVVLDKKDAEQFIWDAKKYGIERFLSPEISLSGRVVGTRAQDDDVPEEIVNEVVKKIRFNTVVLFDQNSLYYDGPFENTGSIPPKSIYCKVWNYFCSYQNKSCVYN
jgi:phosphoribosylformylglycinamidine cyclo-ligase